MNKEINEPAHVGAGTQKANIVQYSKQVVVLPAYETFSVCLFMNNSLPVSGIRFQVRQSTAYLHKCLLCLHCLVSWLSRHGSREGDSYTLVSHHHTCRQSIPGTEFAPHLLDDMPSTAFIELLQLVLFQLLRES